MPSPRPPLLEDLLRGPLWASASWPLTLSVRLCDLRPAFLEKGRAGRGWRAVARNGRVLLASRLPLAELAGRVVAVRFQTWRRTILPGEPPEPWGVLLWVGGERGGLPGPTHEASLLRESGGTWDLVLDLGGRRVLALRRWEADG